MNKTTRERLMKEWLAAERVLIYEWLTAERKEAFCWSVCVDSQLRRRAEQREKHGVRADDSGQHADNGGGLLVPVPPPDGLVHLGDTCDNQCDIVEA
jgi:hypothetical protein